MSTELIRSGQGWLKLQDEWDSLLTASTFPSVFLSFDYLYNAYNAFHAHNSEPFILAVRNPAGSLIGIAPFRRSIQGRRGFRHAILEYLATWEMDKPYVIAAREHEETVWGAVCAFLDANPQEWDLIRLMEMPDNLDGIPLIRNLFSARRYSCRTEAGPDSPLIDLTRGWDGFLAGHRKYRTALHKLKKMDGGFKLITYRTPADIEQGLEEYLDLEKRSWKLGRVGLQKDPTHTQFYRQTIPALAGKGRASIHFLAEGAGRHMAGIICISLGRTVYPQHTVYDPEFAHFSPGKLIMGLALKEHMADPALSSADLLCGFADYYKPWASQIESTTNISVFRLSPSMRLSLVAQRIRELL
jgi:CelD/BcsL family acetyltransferase involved in cellulose biosynthesis